MTFGSHRSLRQNSYLSLLSLRLRSFLFNMNQAPYQLSWQGACPGAVLPAPTHSQALRAPSGVCGPVPFSPMSGRPPGRSWNSPVKRNRRSRNEKADTSVSAFSHLGSRSKKAVTSGYRFCTHHASPLHSGRNCSL